MDDWEYGDSPGWSYPEDGYSTATNTGYSPAAMSSGSTDYTGVLTTGISRFFDVAQTLGQLSLVKNMPYMQNTAYLPNGQVNPAYQQQNRTNTMLLLIAAGIAFVMIAKR